jgi:hypothetical protein
VRGTGDHRAGFVSVRVWVKLAVRAPRRLEETARVGDSEVPPYAHGDTHAIHQWIVANDRYSGHADMVRVHASAVVVAILSRTASFRHDREPISAKSRYGA